MKYAQGSFITVPSRNTLRGVHPTAQALYMWLCSYANETGDCFPSRKTLAEDVGCSERTVDAMLDILCETGLLKKAGRKDGDRQLSNLYTVLVIDTLAGAAIPPSKSCPTPLAESAHELNPVLTQTIEGGELPLRRVLESDSDEKEKIPKVIPFPYSVEATKAAWSTGELRLQVLNWYFTQSGLWARATTSQRLKALMARHNNASVRIARAEWSPGDLKEAKSKIDANESLNGEWTLETLEKYLTK